MRRRLRATAILLVITQSALVLCADEKSAESIAAVRSELLAAFVAPRAAQTDDEQSDDERAAESRRHADRVASLRPVVATFTLVRADRRPLAGVAVRAWNTRLDIVTPTSTTDRRGAVDLSLPPGPWRLGVAGDAGGGVVAFDRIELQVPATGSYRVDFAQEVTLRFRAPGGGSAQPDRVDLATSDHEHRHAFDAKSERVRLLRHADGPILVHATRAPGGGAGFIARRSVTTGDVDIAIADGATTLTFPGGASHEIDATIQTTDPVDAPLRFRARAARAVLVSGVPEIAVGYGVSGAHGKYEFYPAALTMDGRARTFEGSPPFDVSAGYVWNSSSRFQTLRHSASVRVFLRDANGLIMRGSSKKAPFPVQWVARVDGEEIARGEMNAAWRTRIAGLDGEKRSALRLALTVPTAGLKEPIDVAPEPAREIVRIDRLGVVAMPQQEPHARVWARWARDLMAAFEQTHPTRPPRLQVTLWVDAMPKLSGWGGWNDTQSYAYFSDARIFGFVRPDGSNDGTVSHEFTHAFHRQKHDPVFQAMQSRAVRRMSEIRRDRHRVPAGNRFLDGLSSLSGEVPPVDPVLPAAGAAAAESDALDEDDFLAWYLRAVIDPNAATRYRTSLPVHRWNLTLCGFSEDEIRAAVLSGIAGENAAWLIRIRGGEASDARVARAVAEMQEPSGAAATRSEQSAARARWKAITFGSGEDLDARLDAMRADLGDWIARGDVELAAAAAALHSGDRPSALRHARSAIASSWHMGRAAFEERVAQAATLLRTGDTGN